MFRRMSVTKCMAAVVHCDGKSWSTPVLLFLLLLCLALLIPSTALAAPSISLAPSSGLWGTTTTVTGSGFQGNKWGWVWFDTDGDSVRDTGESAKYVRTTNQGAIPSGTSVAAASDVAAGTYQVRADFPSGFPIETSTPFTVVRPTVTASAGGNGSISPSGSVEVEYRASQSFSIVPETGYHVVDVLVDGSSVGAVTSYTFSNATADHTISASFAIDTFTITASAGANGTISPSGDVVVNYGSNRTFSIAPNTGYHVADVLVDGASVGQVTSYEFASVTGNHSISATFAIDVYTITASAGANGSISPSGRVWLTYGSDQAFAIVPDTSCYIADVLVDGVSVGGVSSYQFTGVEADHAIAVTFVLDTTPPAAPTRVAPSNWKVINGSYSLDWTDVSDPAGVTYELTLYDSSWSVIANNTGLTTSAYPVSSFGTLPDGTYYWKVRALDGVGNAGAWSVSSAFKFAGTIPAAPVQVSPSAWKQVTGSSVLDWTDVSDPEGITYQVRLRDYTWALAATASAASSQSTLAPFSALADGIYYWDVRAIDGAGIGGPWSTSRAIKLANSLPAAPALVSPSSWKQVNSASVLDWSDVSDPDGVTYQVRMRNSTWALAATASVSSSECTLALFSSLPDGIYYWDVKAVDGAGFSGAWSTSRAIKLANTVPAAPTLLSPSAWTRVNSSDSLDWSDVTDPEGVTYQVRLRDSTWALAATASVGSSSECTLALFSSLPDGTYYWDVRALDGAGFSGGWSSSRAIKLDATVPSAPALVSPGDGSSTSSTPTLDWSDVTDASGVKYQVQLDDNSDFSSPLLDVAALAVSEYTVVAGENLPAGVYYWRARAVDGAGNFSAWTGAWSLVVV